MNEDFYDLIYAIVLEIPKGKVTSYGVIAQLAGYPKNARLVGRALRDSSFFGDYPCHRVLHSDGTLVEGWDEQRDLLEAEDVSFLQNGKVNMKKHLWKG